MTTWQLSASPGGLFVCQISKPVRFTCHTLIASTHHMAHPSSFNSGRRWGGTVVIDAPAQKQRLFA